MIRPLSCRWSNQDHAGYLGMELQKAENALNTGSEYVQDRD
ncbi:DUF4346 domain-containing protein [Nostoc sp. NMS7]